MAPGLTWCYVEILQNNLLFGDDWNGTYLEVLGCNHVGKGQLHEHTSTFLFHQPCSTMIHYNAISLINV